MADAVASGEKKYQVPAYRSAPLPVDGIHRRLKTLVATALLAVFFITPWLRWNRGPLLPDQAILFDMDGRALFIFGFEFWPQDLPIAVGIMIMSAVGLFLVTTLSGRLWCGFACPHTVWTDLFFRIERTINRLAGTGTVLSRILRLLSWAVIAFLTGATFAAYFHDAFTLPRDLIAGTAGFATYATIGVLTLFTWLLGGFARERVCLYMCPWPRFQAAVLDHQSLVVTYQDWRGEPRGKKKMPLREDLLTPAAPHPKVDADLGALTRGDCIDCTRCVAVCPTHVDIRKGLQLGCIGCGLCIDACDDVMTKIDRPKGLIRFDTEAGLERRSFTADHITVWRPKVLFYGGFWLFVGALVLYGIFTLKPVYFDVEALRSPPFVQLASGAVRNDYSFRIAHRMDHLDGARLTVSGLDGAELRVPDSPIQPGAALDLPIDSDRSIDGRLSLIVPEAQLPHGHHPITFILTDPARQTELARFSTTFWGPP